VIYSFLERTHKILRFDSALPRDVSSLQSWASANGCISRDETEYLEYEQELASLLSFNDRGIKEVEDWVENLFIRYYKGFRAVDICNNPYFVRQIADRDVDSSA
jgi:hypothetical protein